MKRIFIVLIILIAVAAAAAAEDADEGEIAYNALTKTADFNYKPEYDALKYQPNYLIQDIEVSAIEAIPFGFILTFGGLFIYEALNQNTWQPKMKTVKEYTPVYIVSIGSFAAFNVLINTLFFYDYKEKKEETK